MASDKLRKLMADTGEELPMDISSMIDLVFLLLIFFMVSSHLIIVQIDRDVNPPTAKHGQVPKNATGRVVINVLEDGTIRGQDKLELPTTESITEYVETARLANQEKNLPTRLNLRADRNVRTQIIKRVIKASGEAGVSDVIFGSYKVDKK